MRWKDNLLRALHWMTASVPVQRGLDLNVSISHALMGVGSTAVLEGTAERGFLRALFRGHRGSCCLFDVGANTGQFLRMALAEGRQHALDIHCFEPSATAFRSLSAEVAERPSLTLNNLALGREPGTATLFADHPGSGMASLTRRTLRDAAFTHAEPVQVDTLDDYCLRRAVERIDLLKIDVEGHELDVLAGGAGMFQRRAVGTVLFEFGGPAVDTRTFFKDFYVFFQAAGMSLARLTPSGSCVPLRGYRGSYEQFRGCSLLVASR